MRGGDVDRPSLAAVAGRTAVFFDRMVLEDCGGVRPVGILRRLESLEQNRLVAGDATVRTAQLRHPDLLHAARHRLRAVGAELLGDLSPEVVLVPAPVVFAVAP